ncbi:hypothetical protein [Pseudonocardia endophytica]|uniref:Uncharacterized protein n=1 Tax=Pseudonocardia endophytica TaxID=401976 RepID=A0A4R1HUP5_PSEEN|nr:hypothetical protein [Pseudonocardia endophytica]TCK26434.1 hypothetical protein EV378_2271 [Pseudonocardia endophytica]
MDDKLRSALIAGLIAAVIWTVISLLTGAAVGPTLVWAVVFFVGTAVVSWLVYTAIARSRAPRA